MNFEEAEIALQAHFATEWDENTPVAWPDVDFPKPDATWCRFNVLQNAGSQASIGSPGSNYFRRIGIITIQVFGKENAGREDVREKANEAADIYMANDLAGFEFKNVNVKKIGADGLGWYQYNVTAEYRYDTTT